MSVNGHLSKMQVQHGDPVRYWMRLDDERTALNSKLGEQVELRFEGEIHCIECGRLIRKSYSQGHCFPCSQRLASCDICIVKPERCHYDQGTCREPQWGDKHCMQPHLVYLANSSGLKVGITREGQIPTRWIDQGAVAALPILRVQTRFQSGLVEVALARHVSDRTDWRAMLRGTPVIEDLLTRRDQLLAASEHELAGLRDRFGADALQLLPAAEPLELRYPVLEYPDKIRPLNLDKTPVIQGRLQGIKGQYLILDSGVLNIRKFTGYRVTFTA
jgi:hypothetical protein